MLKSIGALLVLLSLVLAGCSSDKKTEVSEDAGGGTEQPTNEPDFIKVQHILIGFTGSVRGKEITRTQEEAEQLAADLLAQAKAGGDFEALVKQYTDDAHPGIYKMANFGVPGDMTQNIYTRPQMVAAFGDVGFPLKVGGIGMAPYDLQSSPFGWHIIKRVE